MTGGCCEIGLIWMVEAKKEPQWKKPRTDSVMCIYSVCRSKYECMSISEGGGGTREPSILLHISINLSCYRRINLAELGRK